MLGPALIGESQANSFHIGVQDQETFDNNLYRLSKGVDATTTVGPGASEQDHINSPSVDLTGQYAIGRQFIELGAQVQDNIYANNSNLNNVSSTDRLTWNWGLGGVLSGQVGADYLRNLVSFVNATTYSRIVYNQTEYFTGARYEIGPHWAIYGGLLNTVFSAAGANENDSRNKAVDMGAELATGSQSSVSIDYRYTDSRYPTSLVIEGFSFDPDFREDRVRILAKRNISEKTAIDVAVGYLRRQYQGNDVIGSFSGPVWRATVSWHPTEKTQFLGITWRQLQSYLTDQTNYYRSTGVSISPVWNVTEKLVMTLTLSREDQTFIGSSINVVNEIARKDTINAQSLDLKYTPLRALIFDLSYRHEQRDSNERLRTYTDGLAMAAVKFLY